MNSKKFTDLLILCLTILLANILVEVITTWAGKYTCTPNVYKSNAILMAVTVLIYYPAFRAMNGFLKASTKNYFTKTRKMAGGSFMGIIAGFLLALIVLYFINLKVRFDIDIIAVLLKK